MPGMGMGMGFNLEQRLDQRLEQKQSIRLTLSTLAGFSTSAEEDSVDQKDILEKLVRDLDRNVYSDWQDFYNRCMKRIKKEDRSENIKELIKAIRFIVENTKPDLEGIRSILNFGIYSSKRNEIPKVVLMHFEEVLKTKACESLEDKVQLIRVGEIVEANKGPITSTYEFLDNVTKEKKFAPRFKQVISNLSRLGEGKADVIRFVNSYFAEILEKETEINEETVSYGFEFVEQLYELTKEKVEEDYISDARRLLGKKDFSELKEKSKNIPKPILANLVKTGLDIEIINKVNELFGQKYLKEGTDARRRIFRSLYALDFNPEKKRVLEHLFANVNSGEYISRILAQLEILEVSRNFTYFFEETDGSKINKKLNDYALNNTLKVIGLSDDYKEKVAENPHRLLGHNLINMISTFGGVLSGSYPEGIQLLREITEHVIDDNFQEWRYSHDKAKKQLKCLKPEENLLDDLVVKIWRSNATSERLIGDLEKINPKIDALKIISEELKIQYQEITKSEATEVKAKELEKRVEEISSLFKSNSVVDKKSLALEKKDLILDLETLDTILAIEKASPERFAYLNQAIEKLISRISYEDMKITFGEARKILNSPEIKELERVTVVETDLPHKLFDIGRTPIQSCQRWNERTGYNKCLLAYLADSNKKLYQVLDQNGNVIIRSVVRLLPFDEESPILLVERPYASRWTEDYGKVLFSQIAQRALELSEALGNPVSIGSNDPRIITIMNKFIEKYDSKLEEKNYQKKLPESKNEFEYSDSFGGCLSSGAKVNSGINHVFIERD